MFFRQILHEDLSCASYLVGDAGAGVAAVIDPQWSIEPYLRLSRLHGVRIEHVLETHNHADHVSGHGRLARATGATIHVHELADAQYPHEAFADGWRLSLGEVEIEAMHTPGHRPEHTSFLLRDADRGGDPWAVLTGDSLFVGDVARPDLAIEKREGAADIYRSLHHRLLPCPTTSRSGPGTWAARPAAARGSTTSRPRRSASSAATTGRCGSRPRRSSWMTRSPRSGIRPRTWSTSSRSTRDR